MNHSEDLALHLLAQTRALMSDPSFLMPDWSGTILILSLAVLILICTLLATE